MPNSTFFTISQTDEYDKFTLPPRRPYLKMKIFKIYIFIQYLCMIFEKFLIWRGYEIFSSLQQTSSKSEQRFWDILIWRRKIIEIFNSRCSKAYFFTSEDTNGPLIFAEIKRLMNHKSYLPFPNVSGVFQVRLGLKMVGFINYSCGE